MSCFTYSENECMPSSVMRFIAISRSLPSEANDMLVMFFGFFVFMAPILGQVNNLSIKIIKNFLDTGN